MCFNPEVSLATFIFGCISAIIVHKLNILKKTTIIIILSFTIIQFIEFLTWIYLNDRYINKILSIIAFILIIIQMLLLQIFMLKPLYRLISLISFFIFAILFIIIQLPKVDFRMTRGKNKHLAWHWLDLPIIWIIIGLCYYLIPAFFHKSGEYFTFIFTFTTIIISLYFYYKYKTWGSMWCYISNLLWIIAIIYSIISIKV
jgi:hypothetical protein